MKIDLIERLGLGAFVGCFVVMFVMVLGSYIAGPQNVSFTGLEIINAFLGSIVVGWAFSLSGLIYEGRSSISTSSHIPNGNWYGCIVCCGSLLAMDANQLRNRPNNYLDCNSLHICCNILGRIFCLLLSSSKRYK